MAIARYYIGVDPGASGGIAVLDRSGGVETVVNMPQSEREIFDFFNEFKIEACAVLEQVRSGPKMGVVSAFTFGRGYGALRMALTASGVSFVDVTPQKWQRAMGCLLKTGRRELRDAPAGKKNMHKARAFELFPNARITHATADALLMAEYCRREEVARLTF